MPRPLFGYRQRAGIISKDADEAAIVARVLAAPKGAPMHHARLLASESHHTLHTRITAIRRHATQYRAGIAYLGLPANPRLAFP